MGGERAARRRLTPMGAQLVSKAYAFAARSGLGHRDTRLLAYMALVALDTDEVPRYFAARDSSALALGFDLTEHPDHEGRAFQAVKEATARLVKVGAIRNVKRGRIGQRAEYQVTLSAPVENSDAPADRGSAGLPLPGSAGLPLRGSAALPRGVVPTYPQGTTEEPLEELLRGITPTNSTTSLAAVDNSEAKAMNEPRCDRHVGEPFPSRCVDCDELALDAQPEACDRHLWLSPCPKCAALAGAEAA